MCGPTGSHPRFRNRDHPGVGIKSRIKSSNSQILVSALQPILKMEKVEKSWGKFLDFRSFYGINLLIPEREKFLGSRFRVTAEPTFGSIPRNPIFFSGMTSGKDKSLELGLCCLVRPFPGNLGANLDLPALPTLVGCPLGIRIEMFPEDFFFWIFSSSVAFWGKLKHFPPSLWLSSLDFPPSPGILHCLLIQSWMEILPFFL